MCSKHSSVQVLFWFGKRAAYFGLHYDYRELGWRSTVCSRSLKKNVWPIAIMAFLPYKLGPFIRSIPSLPSLTTAKLRPEPRAAQKVGSTRGLFAPRFFGVFGLPIKQLVARAPNRRLWPSIRPIVLSGLWSRLLRVCRFCYNTWLFSVSSSSGAKTQEVCSLHFHSIHAPTATYLVAPRGKCKHHVQPQATKSHAILDYCWVRYKCVDTAQMAYVSPDLRE